MGSKVVSTKISEEEYGKLVGICSAKGFTVSKMLKRAIIERMKEETGNATQPSQDTPKPIKKQPPVEKPKTQTKKTNEDRFQYY